MQQGQSGIKLIKVPYLLLNLFFISQKTPPTHKAYRPIYNNKNPNNPRNTKNKNKNYELFLIPINQESNQNRKAKSTQITNPKTLGNIYQNENILNKGTTPK